MHERLCPEVDPLLGCRVSDFRKNLVILARTPVLGLHGLLGGKVLVPGELVIGFECLESSIHDFELDVIGNDTGLGILGQFGAHPPVQTQTLEINEILAGTCRLGRLSLGGDGSDSLVGGPLGTAHEHTIKATEASASCAVEAELPLNTHEGHVDDDAEFVLVEVLCHNLERVVGFIEAGPPGIDLRHNSHELAVIAALSK